MNISKIKKFDASNGDGIRVSVFVSGCSIRCIGCHNQEAWDFNVGTELTEQLKNEIISNCENKNISGLSILGGEPLDPKNRDGVLDMVSKFREKFGDTKTIWLWTGYTFDQLKKENDKVVLKILNKIDTLVDGPFIEEKKNVTLKFRGSTNQRIIERRQKVKNTN